MFDELIEVIDRLAYEKNTNRSQLINDILAKEVGLLTPEQRVSNIIDDIIRNIKIRPTNLQLVTKNEGNSLQYGTFLKYKYNPNIKYSFEFNTSNNKKYVMLKVNSRTTSRDLAAHLDNFFNIISYVDRQRSNEIHSSDINISMPRNSNNRFCRVFLSGMQESARENEVAKFLSNYLLMIDQSMKYYFTHYNNISVQNLTYNIDKIYCNYLDDLHLL